LSKIYSYRLLFRLIKKGINCKNRLSIKKKIGRRLSKVVMEDE